MDEQEEIWKDIPGYEGYYQVSNFGRVKSLERTVVTIEGTQHLRERFMKTQINKYGYEVAYLHKYRVRKSFVVHRLIGMAFLGYSSQNRKYALDHIDGNKTNNILQNLRIVSWRENCSTCYRVNQNRLSSNYIGVSWHNQCKKWLAQIQINGKRTSLGLFNLETDAATAYQTALSNHLKSKHETTLYSSLV